MILDIMRREKKLFLGLLLVPLILGLVAYLIPGLSGGVWGGGLDRSTLAKVGSTEITGTEFSQAYHRFLRNSRVPYDRQFLKSLQLDQQILNQLITKEITLVEARRLGIDATDKEIQQRILSLPYFVENGSFMMNRYEAILRQNGMTIEEFEDGVRMEIIQDKLRNLITDAVSVGNKEVETEYRDRNEKVKIDYVLFTPADFVSFVSVTDPSLKSYFEANKENYRVPEQRRVRYLLIDGTKIRETLQIPEAELKNYYQQNLQTYQLPEKVRAAHILFKTEAKAPQDVEKIKEKATEVLLQAKHGADFAELAKKYSQDSSAAAGGDLGLFGRGQMVPEFEKVAFSLGVGAISDLVTTQYGFHIIKVLDRQPAHTQKFEEVVNIIRNSLLQRKAEQAAQDLSDRVYARIKNNQTLDQVSVEFKLPIQDTGFFSAGSPVPALGSSQDFSNRVFSLKPKEIAAPVRIPSGFGIPQLEEVKAPRIPDFAEVRARVEEDYRSTKAVDLARSKAQEVASRAKAGTSLEALAKELKLTMKTSDAFPRKGNIPDLGSSEPIDGFAFSAQPGDISQPIPMGQKHLVVRLKEKTPVNPEEYAKARDGVREMLLSQRRDQVYSAYLEQVKNDMLTSGRIKVNETLFADLSRRL
ncbi:MAG TPA: peptidyl-prolyl cis-trans isomerase [Terriglobia bacterium]|nr:peptidyl-prolyl cis-trans isomerase [Terriglobia bacterium]